MIRATTVAGVPAPVRAHYGPIGIEGHQLIAFAAVNLGVRHATASTSSAGLPARPAGDHHRGSAHPARAHWPAPGPRWTALASSQNAAFYSSPADRSEGFNSIQYGGYRVDYLQALAGYAQLAFAEGDPDRAALLEGAAEGLRRRAGLRAWPHLRQVEADLVAQVRQRLGVERFDQAFAAGSRLTQQQAVAIVRDQRGTATPAP